MQSNVNVVVMECGVVKTPELRYTPDGLAYTKFSVANNSITYKKGEKTEEVSFFDVSAWGKLAEICSQYLKKGRKIILAGKIKQSRWKTEEGKTKSAIHIVAQDIKFLPNNQVKKAS